MQWPKPHSRLALLHVVLVCPVQSMTRLLRVRVYCREHRDEVSGECASEIFRRQENAADDFRLDKELFEACQVCSHYLIQLTFCTVGVSACLVHSNDRQIMLCHQPSDSHLQTATLEQSTDA